MIQPESGERNERMPRRYTGILRYAHPHFAEIALERGEPVDMRGMPRFAVCGLPIVFDREGLRDIAGQLSELLTESEREILDLEGATVVGEGPYPAITDRMECGEIRRITPEDYVRAAAMRLPGGILVL